MGRIARTGLTLALLAFVAVSVGYLVYQHVVKKPVAAKQKSVEPSTASTTGDPAAPAAAPTAPGDQTPVAEKAPAAPRFVVYYFHGTKRCHTCMTIQDWSEEAVTVVFAGDLKRGTMALRDVNIEDDGNEHYATDYQITGSTLVVAEMKDGAPVRYEKLDKTWDLTDDKPAFLEYVSVSIDEFMVGDQAGGDGSGEQGGAH